MWNWHWRCYSIVWYHRSPSSTTHYNPYHLILSLLCQNFWLHANPTMSPVMSSANRDGAATVVAAGKLWNDFDSRNVSDDKKSVSFVERKSNDQTKMRKAPLRGANAKFRPNCGSEYYLISKKQSSPKVTAITTQAKTNKTLSAKQKSSLSEDLSVINSEEQHIRQLEHKAFLARRLARMQHSDNSKMIFSRRTCYNMTHNKLPHEPDHSPIKAVKLKHAFQHCDIVKIYRSTRQADTIIKFKNNRLHSN